MAFLSNYIQQENRCVNVMQSRITLNKLNTYKVSVMYTQRALKKLCLYKIASRQVVFREKAGHSIVESPHRST